jgi:hypothetical protein
MPKYLGELIAKRAHIQRMKQDVDGNITAVTRIGGEDVVTLGDESAFQQERLEVLAWAETASELQIRNRLALWASQLPPEVLACKYGVTRGLPRAMVRLLAGIELLELVLGEHEGQVGRRLRS